MRQTLTIQCLNYFEYKTLKEELVKMQWSMPIQYMDSTYTHQLLMNLSLLLKNMHRQQSLLKFHSETVEQFTLN